MVSTPKAMRREEEVFIKGKIKWCKHLRPDMTFAPGKWSVVMYIEGPELEKVREWQADGIRNSVKKDDDGWYITLSRKCAITVRGREVGLEPPKVIDKEGNVIAGLVGNGSDGVAKCMLWTFNPTPQISGKALRWEALRVDNLVTYAEGNDYPVEELTTLKEQPEMLF